MVEIKIRRKRQMVWWPVLLLLLVPLVWYLMRMRESRVDAATGSSLPAMAPPPPAASEAHPTLPTPPVASSAPPVTSRDVSTPVVGTPSGAARPGRPAAPSHP